MIGRPFVELGGTRAWKQYVKGDIVASLQWIDLGGDDPEPCLALFSTRLKSGAGAYVVTQAKAHQYADSRGNPTPHLLRAGFAAAVQMGFFPDSSTVHRVIDVIVDTISDLILMPTLPPEAVKRPVRGIEATLSVNGKPVAEAVV